MIGAEYVCHMGSDLLVVNAARVSFRKRHTTFDGNDAKLVRYLAEHKHWTPFAHPHLTVHCTAPFFVVRQAFKHKIGFVENEVSRRYVDDEPEFFAPEEWRGRAEDKKQGSGEVLHPYTQLDAFHYLDKARLAAIDSYHQLLAMGVAPEQARIVLPMATMTEWYWTASLVAFARFCKLRMSADAQRETAVLADSIAQIIDKIFPVCWPALMEARS